MGKIKDEEIKNLSMPKQDFYNTLKKASRKKSKPSQSETKKS